MNLINGVNEKNCLTEEIGNLVIEKI